jgi:DNA (cytosine-5)-methyltransferase 1
MRELHLFAGAGGGVLGGILLGHACVCAVEIEPYRRSVLLQRQRDGILPKFPIWDDVRSFDGKPWHGKVDIVCGGFPCKNISNAGDKSGITGKHSGLWKEQIRIIGDVLPDYVFVENSSSLIVRGIGVVLGDLALLGYDCRYGVLGGAAADMDTDGKRLWILAKAMHVGWPEVVHGFNGKCKEEKFEFQKATSINSPSLLDRIRKHEALCGSPAVLGELDGMANRVDRLASAGDGQIPSVVELAWKTLASQWL